MTFLKTTALALVLSAGLFIGASQAAGGDQEDHPTHTTRLSTLAQQEQVEAVLIARVILNQKVKRLEAIFKAAGIESINLNSGNAKRAISAYRPGDEWALEDLLAQLGLIETHTDQEVPASQILLPDTHSIQETPIQAAQEESRDDRMIRVQDELIAAQDPLVIKALQAELVALYSQA